MKQPQPSAASVALWLKNVNRDQLQDEGWISINKRFYGIARAARPFLQSQFTSEQDQAAAFDGLTLALLAVAHFEDIGQLAELFAEIPETKKESEIELPLPIENSGDARE
jgi:hypothetical protein